MRLLAAAALILCTGAASARPVRLGIESALTEEGELGLRAELRGEGWEAAVFCAGGRARPLSVSAGFSCPWLAAGPLAPGGLLRQAENPLGFTAGSGVFAEDTSLGLDGSLRPSGVRGAALSPLPGVAVFALLPEDREGLRAGLLASFPLPRGAGLDFLYELSDAPADAAAAEWYGVAPLFPGGTVAHAAGRVSWETPQFSGALAAGVSGCAAAPAGCFIQLGSGVEGECLSAELLLAAASRDYRLSDGGSCRDLLQGEVRLSVGTAGARVVFRHGVRVGPPERPCREFLPLSVHSVLLIERDLSARGALRLRMAGECGAVSQGPVRSAEPPVVSASLLWGTVERESELTVGRKDGSAFAGCTLRWGMARFTLEGQASLESDGRKEALSAGAALGFSRPGVWVRIRGGLRSLQLPGCVDPLSRATLTLQWSVATTPPQG